LGPTKPEAPISDRPAPEYCDIAEPEFAGMSAPLVKAIEDRLPVVLVADAVYN
jgi:hypothetical protein